MERPQTTLRQQQHVGPLADCAKSPTPWFLSLEGAATSIIFVVTTHVFCRDKSMLGATKPLCRQNYIFHDKIFCRNKSKIFVATNTCMSPQKSLVTTKVLSGQKYVCRDKRRIMSRQTRVCRDKNDICGSSRQ